jgi:hypothetical protein
MRKAALILLLTLTTQAQFQIQNSHTTASLRGIHALNDQIAWASGTNGIVLHTTDGGATWQICTTPPDAEKLDFRGIQAFNQNTAIVMSSGKGDLSRLYKTTDACRTWKLLFTNPDKEGFWDALLFLSPQHGFLLGDPVTTTHMGGGTSFGFYIRETVDGGANWARPSGIQTVPHQGESIFAASNSALTTYFFKGDLLFVTGGFDLPEAVFLHTRNHIVCDCPWEPGPPGSSPFIMGTSELLPIRGDETSGAFSVQSNDKTVVVVGGNYKSPEDTSNTAAYLSLGARWQQPQTPPHGYRSAVAYDSTTKTWITVGPNGTDISRDDGRNWTALKPSPQDAPDADKNWNALSLPFVVGPNGRIGKLTPGVLKGVP